VAITIQPISENDFTCCILTNDCFALTVVLQPKKTELLETLDVKYVSTCLYPADFLTALSLGGPTQTVTTDSAAKCRGNIQWFVFALAYQFYVETPGLPEQSKHHSVIPMR
jgi:hypothetical protein